MLDDVVDELNVAAFTLIVMITKAPTFILLSVQLTVVVAEVYEQVPCDDGIETDEYVTSPGRMSVTATPVATAGPLFVTCSV